MSSILNSLSLKNYKAFSEADIEIKPLTILLGANSSGKSSILQLILAIEQTVNNKDSYASALKLNGHYVNLGEDINIIKDKNRDNTLSIEFGLDTITFLDNFKKRFRKLVSPSIVLARFFHFVDSENKTEGSQFPDSIKKYIKDETTAGKKHSDIPFISFQTNNREKARIINEYYLKDYLYNTGAISNSVDWKTILEVVNNDTSEHHDLINEGEFALKKVNTLINDTNTVCTYYYSLLASLNDIDKIYISYDLFFPNKSDNRLSVRRCCIKLNETEEIGYYIPKSNNSASFFSTIKGIEIQETKTITINFNGLQPKHEENFEPKIIDNYVYSLIQSAYMVLDEMFASNDISYVGPLRAYPQRYYFLDESNSSYYIDAQNGQRLAETLKRDKKMCDKINTWLKEFDINISVEEFRDIIHNIKVTQNGLKLDITDVGFGYSQILPILVQGFMSENKSINIIEQPEIHLHPKMQASLADLFIDIITSSTEKHNKSSILSKQKTFIIETHSEYMLKRLRRRIAEGKMSSNDIAIYFIESRNNTNTDSAKVRRVNVSEMGDIDWPEDFYITAYDDDMEFLKRRIQESKNNQAK